ncbi:hypothetical protein FB561_4834 [Kribbella amoyensis]|uniref:Transcriptional regulator, AbiEi antitoxin, Type IV TA system n=1 Tax=Kribbella amoyensis TaxID=996641 RepID=A0A561BXW0_9ACTN|nr:hypothetical protein [Kribbella amoyensis]TWD83668.1 hypothetical protein FB561_4834 [Kribbella amoyensis]
MDRLDTTTRALVVTAAQAPRRRHELRAAGLEDHDLRRLVRRGHLHHVNRYYLDGTTDPEWARLACLQAAYPGSVLSHLSAARLANLRYWVEAQRPDAPPANAVWLTRRPTATRNHYRPDVVLRRAGLVKGDLDQRGILRRTTDARTVVDLARELPVQEALVTVDHALRLGTSMADLDAVLTRQRRWPGIQRARRTIALGDPRAESALESIARAVFDSAKLPRPILQARFGDGIDWMPERVDFWWPQFRTIAEADGLAKYEAETAPERRALLRRAHLRDQRLADLGVELLHFGWEDLVNEPHHLVHRLKAAFTRGQNRPDPQPHWTTAPPPVPRP